MAPFPEGNVAGGKKPILPKENRGDVPEGASHPRGQLADRVDPKIRSTGRDYLRISNSQAALIISYAPAVHGLFTFVNYQVSMTKEFSITNFQIEFGQLTKYFFYFFENVAILHKNIYTKHDKLLQHAPL